MPDDGDTQRAADAVRLKILHATFKLASEELARRRDGVGFASPATRPEEKNGDAAEAAKLNAAFVAHLAGLEQAELDALYGRLARGLLLGVDSMIAGAGTPPGERPDLRRISTEPTPLGADTAGAAVGLVSLPWMSPALPSIQLATLASALERAGMDADVHELYVDYAALIGLNLYSQLGNLLGYLPEWVFSRHYYAAEVGESLDAMIAESPLEDTPWRRYGTAILDALEPVTAGYLDGLMRDVDWSRYDVLGFSLTISQLGASMALARRIKLEHPSVRIVFGGSQCAGIMGRTILRICPYVDVVVHIEGEIVLPELVGRLRSGAPLDGLPGTSWRGTDGEVVSGSPNELYRPAADKLPVDYDAYFRRLIRLGLLEKMNPWVPFESSRGCWYGQKVQCTFCGLHEIMEFRAWDADLVLAELERLEAKYGVRRFYSMDLIMPREYLRTLLPEIARRGHKWMFFYEMKANLKRSELETMVAAGVRWIQPGIESLDGDLLRLMKKGVTPAQNILLLKWSEELGIFCGWNLLYGLPGETQESYARMAALIPKLTHLQPPSGGGQFQLHRFSPYFDWPEEFGLRWTGAHPMFRYAFPISDADLNDLVYLHEFELEGAGRLADVTEVEALVDDWRDAYRDGATLHLDAKTDASSLIVDRRDPKAPPALHQLSAPETELYRFLDRNLGPRTLQRYFASERRATFEALGGADGVDARIERWIAHDLVVAVDGKLVGLALDTATMSSDAARRAETENVRASIYSEALLT